MPPGAVHPNSDQYSDVMKEFLRTKQLPVRIELLEAAAEALMKPHQFNEILRRVFVPHKEDVED